MAFSDLLDHTLRIWRPVSTIGPLREERRGYAPLATINAAVRRPSARLAETGPGLAAVGERIVYLEASADVAERDILELLTGPDAPETLEIDSPPTRPRGHHTELTCRLWQGTLPAVVES